MIDTIYSNPWFVYILRCSDKYYYTGISPDVKKRVTKHREGKGAKFTRGKNPIILVYVKKYANMIEASKVEREIKKSQSKKEKLITAFQGDLINITDSEITDILTINNISA